MRFLSTLLIAACLVGPVLAQNTPQEDITVTDASAETRARNIGRALRCVVCQNQSIEESDASLAEDMRRLVRARIAAGETDEEIISFMQTRYGDFVLLKPPVQTNTYILWFGPFLLAGGGLLWFTLQKQARVTASAPLPLTAEENAKLDQLS